MRNKQIVISLIWLLLLAVTGFAQQPTGTRPPDPASLRQAPAAGFKSPDNIEFRTANVISEGVRIHAELFSLKSLAGKPLPTIIQAHGRGRKRNM